MPRITKRKQIKKDIKALKRTLKLLNRPENLDLDLIKKLEELLGYLKEDLNE